MGAPASAEAMGNVRGAYVGRPLTHVAHNAVLHMRASRSCLCDAASSASYRKRIGRRRRSALVLKAGTATSHHLDPDSELNTSHRPTQRMRAPSTFSKLGRGEEMVEKDMPSPWKCDNLAKWKERSLVAESVSQPSCSDDNYHHMHDQKTPCQTVNVGWGKPT